MKPAQLRRLIRRYGNVGMLMVGTYFAAYHLWTKRRSSFLTALAAVLILGRWMIGGIRTQPVPLPNRTVTIQVFPPIVPPTPEPVPPVSPDVYRPRRHLLYHARPVTALNQYYRDHLWISRDRLLLVSSTRSRGEEAKMDEIESLGTWTGRADVLNISTGRRRHLAGLSRLFHHMQATPGYFEISPGGRWLKWINFETPDAWPKPAVARWDGSDFQQWGQDKFSATYWLDDHRWVEEETRSVDEAKWPEQVTVHDAEHKREVRLKLNSKQWQILLRSYASRGEHYFGVDWEDEKTPEPRVTISEKACPQTEDADNISRTDATEPPPLHTYTVQMPRGAKVWKVLISPKTHRILYLLHFFRYAQTAPFQVKEAVLDIWSSKPDGTNLKELGYVKSNSEESGEDENYIRDVNAARMCRLQWLPDGKRFSFIYGGKLYVASSN